MKVGLLIVALLAVLALKSEAWAENIKVFSGMVLRNGAPAQDYLVSLYVGDASSESNETFLQTRRFVTSSRTDSAGAFALIVPAEAVSGHVLTLRAKGFALPGEGAQYFGGQEVIPAAMTVNVNVKGLQINAGQVVDYNYGIRNNHYAVKKMYFVTDRAAAPTPGDFANTASTNFMPSYGSYKGYVALGPPSKPSGTCSSATHWSCSSKTVEQDDAYVSDVTTSGTGGSAQSTWLNAIAAELPTQSRGRILLFVHGYNTDFDGAAETAARLAYESGQRADAIVIYSWPSAHRLTKYTQDQKNVETSVDANFGHVLDGLATLRGRADIVVVAHSLGAYAVTRALSDYTGPQLSSLTLFAGDVDDELFMLNLPRIERAIAKLTIYSSGGDQALRISECYSGDSRLRAGQTPQTFPTPIRWFDATRYAPQGDMGHSYLDESFEVAADFYAASTSMPLNTAEADLAGVPWLTGVDATWGINWGSVTASAACAILKVLP